MIHFKEGKAAGVDERKGGVYGGGEDAGVARLRDGLGGAKGITAQEHGQAVNEGGNLPGDQEGESSRKQGGTGISAGPEGEKSGGQEGYGDARDDSVPGKEGCVREHEVGDDDRGRGEQGEDGDPLWRGEEPGSAAAKAPTAEDCSGEERGQEEHHEFPVNMVDVEVEDIYAAGLEGRREGGHAVAPQQGEVEADDGKRGGEGKGGGPIEPPPMNGAGELSQGEGSPGEEAEDVAEEHASGGEEKKKEGEIALGAGFASALPGQQTKRRKGQQQSVGAGVGGEFSGQAGEQKSRGAEAEEDAGAAAHKAEEEQHGGGEGGDLGETTGERAGGEGGEACAAEQIAERRIEIDEA